MRKLYLAQQAREVDRQAVDRYAIPSLLLMENAGRGAAEVIAATLHERGRQGGEVAILAGAGNNGGDGYVIARHLHNKGFHPHVYLCFPEEKIQGDAAAQLQIWRAMGGALSLCLDEEALARGREAWQRADALVDGLLGTGLGRPVEGWFAEVIKAMNACERPLRIALDLPSGMQADTGHPQPLCFRADITLTFAMRKLGLWMPHAAAWVGREILIDIGVPRALIESFPPAACVLDEPSMRALWRLRPLNSHKGSFGHLLVVAGSVGKVGAALLTSLAALRMGAGLCTLASHPAVIDAIEGRILEVMVERLLPHDADVDAPFSLRACRLANHLASERSAVVIGPGLSQMPSARSLVAALLEVDRPLLLDADALNLLNPALLAKLAARGAPTLLTPHPGEMARLCETSNAQIQADRFRYARDLAMRCRAYIVLKGARTLIASPEGQVWMNPTGNPGMATAGSGDILAGMIGSLLSQGYSAEDAALMGVYLHGAAGDWIAKHRAATTLIASDLLDALPALLHPWEAALPPV